MKDIFGEYLEKKYGLVADEYKIISDEPEVMYHKSDERGITSLENNATTSGFRLCSFQLDGQMHYARYAEEGTPCLYVYRGVDDIELEDARNFFVEEYSSLFTGASSVEVYLGRISLIADEFRCLLDQRLSTADPFVCIPNDGFLLFHITIPDLGWELPQSFQEKLLETFEKEQCKDRFVTVMINPPGEKQMNRDINLFSTVNSGSSFVWHNGQYLPKDF